MTAAHVRACVRAEAAAADRAHWRWWKAMALPLRRRLLSPASAGPSGPEEEPPAAERTFEAARLPAVPRSVAAKRPSAALLPCSPSPPCSPSDACACARREAQARGLPAGSCRANRGPDDSRASRRVPRRGRAASRRRQCSAAAVAISLALFFHSVRSAAAATCDTTCTCSSFGLMGECTSPTPACGFTPCTGGSECPSGPPQSLSAFVTGPGTLALNWTDPADLTMVDQYNIYYSMPSGVAACSGKGAGSSCRFTPPPGSTLVTGKCGPNGEGVMYCWLDFSRYILAVPPCVRASEEDTSCNFQEINTNIIIGTTYQYKIDAGRCCYGDPNILGTPGCRACTDFDAFETCPKSSTYAFASVKGQRFPTAVQDISIRVDGDRALRVDWATPADTGTLEQIPSDILAYVVTRSTKRDFSESLVTTTLSGSIYTLRDTGLTPNVEYYYRVQPKNAACGQLPACGGISITNLTAVGVPSAPTALTLTYMVGRPNVIRGDWATPVDTGLGDGSLNHEQPLYYYSLAINGIAKTLVGSPLNNTFIATGLVSGALYTFVVSATNIAGTGSSISASKIASGLPLEVRTFTSSVNPTDGPLKIRLTWSTPLNTGQGNQVEQITGYKILRDDDSTTFGSPTTVYEATCAQTSECVVTTVVSFTAARKEPYYFRVYARNFIGYSLITIFKQVSEQSVAVPSAPLNLGALVDSENTISLSWDIPADTGVGDTSRALQSYRVERAYGSADMTCTVTCSDCNPCWSQIGACCSTSVGDNNNNNELFYDASSLPQSETRFYFRVYATNDVGEGPASNIANEQSVTINTAASSPTSLVTSIPFANGITLNWDKPADTGVGASCSTDCRPLTYYRLRIDDNVGNTLLDKTDPPSVTTHTISNLDHRRFYTFKVYAANSAGENFLFTSIIEQPVDYPTVPRSFVALVSNSEYKVDMTWQIPEDTGRVGDTEPILKYELEVDLSVNDTFVAANVLKICDGTTTVCTGFTCECAVTSASMTFLARRLESYNFRVRAQNQVGFGGYSFASQQSVGRPSRVPSINASVVGIKQVRLVWERPLDTGLGVGNYRSMQRYIIQRSYGDEAFGGCAYGLNTNDQCSASTYQACCTDSTVAETALFKTLVMPSVGPTYFYFRVLGQNEVGFGLNPTPAREQGVEPPGPIASMEITTIGPAQFKIEWTQVTNSGLGFNNTDRPINKFKLQICQDPVRDFSVLYFEQDFSATTFEFSKYDFLGGRNYTFRVIAFNDAGEGTPSIGITKPAISLPSEPLNFRAVVSVPLQIDLFWVFPLDTGFGDAVTAPLTGYILNISTSADFSTFQEVTLSGSALAWNHTGLTKGTIYYYRIRSQTDAGLSEKAPNATEMAISVPGSPRNFSVKVDSPLTIKVSWAIPEDTGMGASSATPRKLTGYLLRVANSDASIELTDFNLTTTATFNTIALEPTVTNYVLSGLQKGFRYYIQVVALNSAGPGVGSEYLRDRGITKPLSVTNVAAYVPGPFSIYVSWRINNDSGLGPGLLPDQLFSAGGIYVDVSRNSSFANSSQLFLAGTTTNYLFTGLVKGSHYFFRIFSRNRAGDSAASAVVTDRAIDIPSTPRFFTVRTSTDVELQLDLNWLSPIDTGGGDQVSPLNYYLLQESIGKEPNRTTPNITLAPTALIEYRGNRTKGLQYFYRLYAVNDAGESVGTPVISEMAIEKPSVPLNLTVDWMGPMRLFVEWTLPIDTGNGPRHPFPRALIAVDLDIDATSAAFTNVLRTISLSANTINYTIAAPDLVQGTKYYFRVRANNSAGFSPLSNVDGRTAIALPTAPRNLQAVVTSPLEITLTWDTPSNTGGIGQTWPLLNYTIYMAINVTHQGESLVLRANVNSHVEVQLTKAVRYYYRVFAINQAGTGPASNSATEEGVVLPTAPTQFSISTPAELQLRLNWQLPVDTGTGGHSRPLLRYILEKDDVLTSNGSFSASPYSIVPNITCFTKATPPCNPNQHNPMQVSGVDLGLARLFASLQWGNTYYFRIFAVNAAGMGPATIIINEQALVLPSAPVNLTNNLKTQDGLPIFELVWMTPHETGAGNIRRYQDPTGAQTGNVRPVDSYISQAAPVPPGETSVSANFNAPGNTVAISPLRTSTKSNIQIGFVYFFRVAARNRVGLGPWSEIATSGPEVDLFVPHGGPAAGAFDITVYGSRFGAAAANIFMTVGETRCPTIKIVEEDKVFVCVAPPGTGGSKDVVVSIAGIPVRKQRQFIYDAPSITAIVPSLISSQPNQLITVLGKNFGAIDMTPAVFITGKALAPCSFTSWVADTSIRCTTPEVSESVVQRNTMQVVVDSIRNSLLADAPHFNYTDLPTFYSQCLSQPTEECFDCVVSSCYQLETSKAMSTGGVLPDALDFCEATAGKFCKLDHVV